MRSITFLTALLWIALFVPGYSQNVGVGTTDPMSKLDVKGQIRMDDGTQADGHVLVSDADGKASWVNPNDGLSVPNPALAVPIRYQGTYLYVLPQDYTNLSWDDALSRCNNLDTLGYQDWYLPSRLELDAMYKQSYLISGLSQTEAFKYWSSTEIDVDNAISQRLDYGGPDPDLKTKLNNCRCVRLKN